MWCKVFILTVVTVTARKIDPDGLRSYYVPEPKTFGFSEQADFGRKEFNSGINRDFGFGENHKFDQPEFRDHRSFSTDFKHRQFFHSSDGNDRGFGGGNHDSESSFRGHGSRHESGHNFGSFGSQSEFQGGGTDHHHSTGTENRFHQNVNEERTRGAETLGHEIGSGQSESRRNSGSFDTNSGSDFSNFGSNFGSHNFQSRSIGSHRNTENSFNQNSDDQKTIHETQGSGSDGFKTESTDRNVEEEQKELTNKHKQEFEFITTNNKRKFDDHSTGQNIEESKRISPSSDDRHTRTVEPVRENLKTNNHSSITNSSHHNHNIRTQIHVKNTTTQRPNNTVIRINPRKNQRNDAKTTTENEIKPRSEDTNESRTEDDRWIWDSGENKTTTTTKKPEVDLDDRAAFDGAKCPTGKVKVGNMCVDID